ncbi:hypothetical protein HOH87_02390, partial [bacterium]|nr:hypothetical protein [bacterium]
FNELDSFGIDPRKSYGFELSKPLGRWKIRFEVTKSDAMKHFRGDVFGRVGEQSPATEAFADWVIDKNSGRLYAPMNEYLVGLGVDADLDEWLLNFYLFHNKRVPLEALTLEGIELEKAILDKDFGGEGMPEVFGSLHIGRYFKEDKSNMLGFGAGMLWRGIGAMIYYTDTYTENLRWIAGFEALMYWSDMMKDNSDDSEGPTIEPALNIGLSYDF